MLSPLKSLAATVAALSLCASPTMAATTPAAMQPVSPLVAVSVFGTQASAQTVSSQVATVAATAGAAVAAQGQPGQDAAPHTGITAIGWVMIALDLLIAGWGIYTLVHDDNDGGVPASPA